MEINALWYNFSRFLSEVGDLVEEGVAAEAAEAADQLREAFSDAFWVEETGGLADVWRPDFRDNSIRPNQIFAVSLPHSPLDAEKADSVVKLVRDVLLTPYGLRTLATGSQGYCGVYEGNPNERAAAYHNGTVWAWLLGPYGEALLKTSSKRANAVQSLEDILVDVERHLGDAALGTVSEIFDGNEPHTARGAVGQAWSVAEILRLTLLIEKAKGE